MYGIKWSFSSLKQFINCPKQYHEVKVLRNFVVQETEQMRYGTAVHKACEDYVRDGVPLAKNYQRFQPLLDALLQSPGQRYPEIKMALKADGTACDFDDPDRWVRGIADLLVIDGDVAWVSDYKSGSAKYPDTKQLKLMALMVFARFPQVKLVKAALLFLTYNVFVDEQYRREDTEKLWKSFHPDLMRLQTAMDNDVWPTNPTGLCGWCPVTSCKFYRSR